VSTFCDRVSFFQESKLKQIQWRFASVKLDCFPHDTVNFVSYLQLHQLCRMNKIDTLNVAVLAQATIQQLLLA
jgi:hypothetical protein